MSKLWSRIIRSRDFIRSFPSQRSLLQPRILFAFKYLDKQNNQQIWNFYSFSTINLRVSYLSRAACSNTFSPYSKDNYLKEIPHYVNGLVSLGYGQEQIICNSSTRKSITLPKVKSRKKIIRSFFGYDPVDGQYKVLCMSEKAYNHFSYLPSFEHQVFTLGGVDTSWRMIECNILHRPKTKGMCINGVMYYGAFTGSQRMEKWCLVRFNVRSEKFDQVVQFLGDHTPSLRHHSRPSLISYKGKVTLAIEIEQLRYELWVLEDTEKHEWSKVCFSVDLPWILDTSEPYQLYMGGDITHTDEIVFVSHHVNDLSVSISYYDQKSY